MPDDIYTAVSFAKMAEPVVMPFGLWTRVDQRKLVLYGSAHLLHLANTIEPSIFDSPAKWLNQLRSHLGCGLSGPKEPCIKLGVQITQGVIFRGKGHAQAFLTRLCHELCKNGWTDRDAIWVVDSGRWGAHWHHLANTTEPSICGGHSPFYQISYFDHLFFYGRPM